MQIDIMCLFVFEHKEFDEIGDGSSTDLLAEKAFALKGRSLSNNFYIIIRRFKITVERIKEIHHC
ncbi:hypothetical protein CU098_009800 [Rhizopus stolonifer]|uniref:Uncharacterized protein n=1 Tax=Rhizopus stolonifer TaxID=4846 RepID=A0A367KJ21_RHIST|nr:hypothetical protein CU098_009800 [Rhizopus stolonifer]